MKKANINSKYSSDAICLPLTQPRRKTYSCPVLILSWRHRCHCQHLEKPIFPLPKMRGYVNSLHDRMIYFPNEKYVVFFPVAVVQRKKHSFINCTTQIKQSRRLTLILCDFRKFICGLFEMSLMFTLMQRIARKAKRDVTYYVRIYVCDQAHFIDCGF